MNLISHNPHAGLFSQLNFVLTHFEHSGRSDLHVDWREGLVYCEPERGNLFDILFETNGEHIPDGDTHPEWPHRRYTGYATPDLYGENSGEWRQGLHRWWRTLKVKADILEEADTFCKGWDVHSATAAHVRNNNIGTECPAGVAPRLEDYEAALETHNGMVFLATDNDEALEWFLSKLGARLRYRRIPRSNSMATEYHLTRPQTFEDARNCLIDALIMARCSHLVHSVSNIATAVLYMNPGIGHTFVENRDPSFGGRLRRWEIRILDQQSDDGLPDDLIHMKHPNWNDWLLLFENGTFRRHSTPSECGFWQRMGEQKIRIRWRNWDPETFACLPSRCHPESVPHLLNRRNTLCYELQHPPS